MYESRPHGVHRDPARKEFSVQDQILEWLRNKFHDLVRARTPVRLAIGDGDMIGTQPVVGDGRVAALSSPPKRINALLRAFPVAFARRPKNAVRNLSQDEFVTYAFPMKRFKAVRYDHATGRVFVDVIKKLDIETDSESISD